MLLQQAPGTVENPSHPQNPQQPNPPPSAKTVTPPPQQQPQNNQQEGILQRNRRAPNPDEVMLDEQNPAGFQVASAPIYNPDNSNLSGGLPPAQFA